ncbi:MAG: tail fiber domain-containing protein [Gammaproteobacteria bacterium]|nr:tail fiber domain-containing protein [Gammaproteobacteria bacterium]
MSSNDYFDNPTDHSALPKGSTARAEAVDAKLDAITTGFDKLPTENEFKRDTKNYAGTTAGSVDAYTASLTHVVAYNDGQRVTAKIHATNTGTSTLDVESVGPATIYYPDGLVLLANELTLNGTYTFVYNTDLSGWVIQVSSNVSAAAASAAAALASQTAAEAVEVSHIILTAVATEPVAVGYTALDSNTTGANNTAVGGNVLTANTIGSDNTAVGYNVLPINTTGNKNTAVGSNALAGNTAGFENVAVGYNSLLANTEGDYNVAVGSEPLKANTTGSHNVAIGYLPLVANTSGQHNVGIGHQALFTNTTGTGNVAVGQDALKLNVSGTGNVAVGAASLQANTVNSNTAVGTGALTTNTTGIYNVAIGYIALASNTTGIDNVAIGYQALDANTVGTDNTAVGYDALTANTTGVQNTVFGSVAGGTITTGSNLTCLGYNAEPTSATATNEITLGDANVTVLRCNDQTINALSDARDKTNVTPIKSSLDFINSLNPVTFNWDRREWYDDGVADGSKTKKEKSYGFIAQELDKAQNDADMPWLNLVLKSNPKKIEAAYGKLITPMVKAIQELSGEVLDLKRQLAEIR